MATTTNFRASHRFARISARKARYVVDLVRNRPVEEALEILKFTSRRAAPLVAKVVKSAAANAVHEQGLDPSRLVVTKAYVDEGPTLKRFQPRARGMAYPIFKRTSHISIEVGEGASGAAGGEE